MPDSKVNSIYIPQYCLQGEELPAHVLWTGQAQLDIEVRIPEELELKAVYNLCDVSRNKLDGGILRVREVEVPGYLGLVFKSRKLADPRKLSRVHIQVADENGEVLRTTDRDVLLFRPLLRAVNIPSIVKAVHLRRDVGTVKPRLSMKNVGDGTAFVYVEIKGASNVSIGPPKGVDEFAEKFTADVTSGLEQAKGEFSQYSRLLNRFVELARARQSFGAKDRRRIRALATQAQRAYQANHDFHSRVIHVIGEAYFKNLELITEVTSFLDYINSIGAGRVIVANALDVLRLPSGESSVTLQMKLADAGLNSYPPIQLSPVSIVSDRAQEIPIHALFDWYPDSSEVPSDDA